MLREVTPGGAGSHFRQTGGVTEYEGSGQKGQMSLETGLAATGGSFPEGVIKRVTLTCAKSGQVRLPGGPIK